MPFLKLDCGILDSSIWCENPETRIIWITLLAMSDANGLVESTAPGISRRASIPIEATRTALAIFENPDLESKNPENEGKRIQRVNGGYLVLNYEAYRKKDHTGYDRLKRYRENKKMIASNQNQSASDIAPPVPLAAVKGKKSKLKDLDVLAAHLLKELKIPLSDKGQTAILLQSFGLEKMLAAIDRMGRYFAEVKKNRWSAFIIGKHWRNLYEKLEYFSSDENLQIKLQETTRSNSQQVKVDCRTVSSDFSSDEELMRKRREQDKLEAEDENVR